MVKLKDDILTGDAEFAGIAPKNFAKLQIEGNNEIIRKRYCSSVRRSRIEGGLGIIR
jgi:hypothetical protein